MFQFEVMDYLRPFLLQIKSTPRIALDNAFAQVLFPKLIDDMYDLTVD